MMETSKNCSTDKPARTNEELVVVQIKEEPEESEEDVDFDGELWETESKYQTSSANEGEPLDAPLDESGWQEMRGKDHDKNYAGNAVDIFPTESFPMYLMPPFTNVDRASCGTIPKPKAKRGRKRVAPEQRKETQRRASAKYELKRLRREATRKDNKRVRLTADTFAVWQEEKRRGCFPSDEVLAAALLKSFQTSEASTGGTFQEPGCSSRAGTSVRVDNRAFQGSAFLHGSLSINKPQQGSTEESKETCGGDGEGVLCQPEEAPQNKPWDLTNRIGPRSTAMEKDNADAEFFVVTRPCLESLCREARPSCTVCGSPQAPSLKSSRLSVRVTWSCPNGHKTSWCGQETTDSTPAGEAHSTEQGT